MIPTRQAIDGLILSLVDDRFVSVTTPELRVLKAVLERIGPAGFCWSDAFTLADAAKLRYGKGPRRGAPNVQAARRALVAWSAGDHPRDATGSILQRLDARSGPTHSVPHALYYCPRLTGVPAPRLPSGLGFATLIPCDWPECEPELVLPESRIVEGPKDGSSVGTRDSEVAG